MRNYYQRDTVFLLIAMAIICALSYFYVVEQPRKHVLESIYREVSFEHLPERTLLRIPGATKRFAAVERIYIINLPNRIDRRTRSIGIIQTLDLDAIIIPAHNTHSPQVRSRIHLMNHGRITLAELACWASHMQVWLEVAARTNDTGWTLIFEDDIDLEFHLTDILQSFPRELWNTPDLIYLGHCGNPPGRFLFNATRDFRVHQAINPSCTHAYAIRPRTASSLAQLLSSPRKAVDDEICDLVSVGKLLVFSMHPPLAVQQPSTALHPSDVNLARLDSWTYRMLKRLNHMIEWWRGVQFVDTLQDSTLAHMDLLKAADWRRDHEKEFWRSNGTKLS
jgi:GR25 family glycosyltransferase involved in LPS biosynthesis